MHRWPVSDSYLFISLSVAECGLDLNFIVDSSGSVGRKNWHKCLQFVADVVRELAIGPNQVQVALVLFSRKATVEWGLTRYRDKESLIKAILSLSFLGKNTNLNDALYLTRTRIFAPGAGTRSGAIKATVILTDGVDNVPRRRTPLTLQNATACKDDGIRLIAVGVTDGVDEDRLRGIASSPSDYYAVDNFDALTDIVDSLKSLVCTPAPVPSKASHFTCFTDVHFYF